MSTNSIREYSSDELSNIQLGQGGFDMLVSNTTSAYGSGLDGRVMEVVDKENHPTGVEAIYTHTGAQVAGAGMNDSVTTLLIDNGDIVECGIAVNDVIVVGTGANREIMQVTAIDASASPDDLTVTRDYLGLGAFAHTTNADIWWYKEVSGISHWISIKNLSDNGDSGAVPAVGLLQAVFINQRPGDFTGASLPACNNVPNVIVNGTSSLDDFDPASNAALCSMASEDIIYGRFTKVMAGSPQAGKIIYQLTRGYK